MSQMGICGQGEPALDPEAGVPSAGEHVEGHEEHRDREELRAASARHIGFDQGNGQQHAERQGDATRLRRRARPCFGQAAGRRGGRPDENVSGRQRRQQQIGRNQGFVGKRCVGTWISVSGHSRRREMRSGAERSSLGCHFTVGMIRLHIDSLSEDSP